MVVEVVVVEVVVVVDVLGVDEVFVVVDVDAVIIVVEVEVVIGSQQSVTKSHILDVIEGATPEVSVPSYSHPLPL